MRAIRVHQTGNVDVLQFEELPLPEPGPGQARVRLEAIGINYIDTYHRKGLYQLPLPFVPGSEGAGVVDAVGSDVSELRPGDRVVYANVPGAYAEYAIVPVARLVPIPAGVSTRTAAAVMLQGMTAHYLVYSTFPLKAGDTALVHAAAGGVGLLLCQLGRRIGARIIGTVSTAEKESLARAAGASEVIRYTETDFVAEVRHLTGGRGVDVVYDSVGQTTFDGSLNCLRPRGMLALFGQASGPVRPFDPQILNTKGSLFLTRPTLAHYTATREELLWRASDVLNAAATGELSVRIDSTFPLSKACDAHTALEGRGTSGKVLLIP